MTDQISFLPMLEPRDTSFEDNERKASRIQRDRERKGSKQKVQRHVARKEQGIRSKEEAGMVAQDAPES